MRAPVVLVAMTLAAAITGTSSAQPASKNSPPPIWAGVFSAEQAARGAEVIATHCTRCHGEGRALSGDVFMLHWEGHNLSKLFQKMQTMPPKSGGAIVTDQQRLDAMAYVLQQNGFPAGSTDLQADEAALTALVVLPRGGPRPMQSGAIAATVGCLSKTGNTWQLTRATDPQPTGLEIEKESRPTGAASPPPSGANTFQLLNPFPDPSAHIGHTVEVKGLLIRNSAGDRINVVSVETVAVECVP
jgi:mono/diheme cytochrome c family protein